MIVQFTKFLMVSYRLAQHVFSYFQLGCSLQMGRGPVAFMKSDRQLNSSFKCKCWKAGDDMTCVNLGNS
jgi:hypothetical protein